MASPLQGHLLLREAEHDSRIQAAVHDKLYYLVQIAVLSLLACRLLRAKDLFARRHSLLFRGRLERGHCFLSARQVVVYTRSEPIGQYCIPLVLPGCALATRQDRDAYTSIPSA